MTYIQCTTPQPQLIAVAKLEKSPLNTRRIVRAEGIVEMKASILAHGLMQNLVVTDDGDGTFRVIAGGRRLEAIRSLQAEGKLPEDFAVPCQIVAEETALEKSLAENTVRLAMHPADQFDAFAVLIEQGQSAAEVAERFGIDESLVLKRMKLARVAPELLQQYRDGGMTLECLMAYTLTDDHRRQVKVFKSLQDWQKNDSDVIRDALTEKMIDAKSKLARFVGLEAYSAAGGSSRADLFGDDVYLEKPALLNKLAEKKLADIRQELLTEGWNWIEVNPERDYTLVNRCSRIKPMLMDAPPELVEFKSRLDSELEEIEQALEDTESDESLDRQEAVQRQLDEVVEKLTAYIGFDAEHKMLAGCFISIDQDGTPFIEKGLVKPEHRKQLDRLLNPDADGGKAARSKHHLPETLRRRLAEDRLQVAQAEIAKHPAIALDLLAFQAASEALRTRLAGDGPDVQFKRWPRNPANQSEVSAASLAMAAIAKSLPADWLKPKSEADRFKAFRSLPDASKLELLAYSVALTLRPKFGAGDQEATAYDMALTLTKADVAGYWRPGKDNLLSRLTRDQLLSIAREVLGEAWSQIHRDYKKAALVEQLDRAFADPEKYGRNADQLAKLKSWLPAGMPFDVAETPKPKAKKARKAA